MKRQRYMRKGFTLTEILVAIGIIAVLTGFLLPVVSQAQQSSRFVNCISNLRQIGMAFQRRQSDTVNPRAVQAQPSASEWIDVVVKTGEGANKLLFCPDGGNDGVIAAPDQILKFIAHRGNGGSFANGSRLEGAAGWRETRTGTADNFIITYNLHPKDATQRLVVSYTKVPPDRYQAKLIEKHPAYHVDVMNTLTGQRSNRLTMASPAITFSAGYDDGVDYGYNLMASNVADARLGKILVMDCLKSVSTSTAINCPPRTTMQIRCFQSDATSKRSARC